MKHITFHFDVISPYAYLAFEQLPKALEGISHSVTYKPVLFGAILQHFGQLGPAEIAPKRTWTYRQINWLAKQQSTPLQMPSSHPFNPLGLLRLALACGNAGACNRYVTEVLFRHVWQGGLDAGDAQRLLSLTDQLQPARAPDDAAVKAELKANTDAAIARGIFGVPTMEVDGQLFWGLDALPMLRAYLQGDDWFSSSAWAKASDLPAGVVRKR
ncbi:2-hydroxychromene-2-carboxylate isomerase [Variovorax sp. PCZ-1]|uniref:2-hydroxychromene-2-carboxylate isomerase n=1 Tax=Variovorax sp. PCZ-1 TaxID=2835533 RepID=UPI001BCEFE5A|nr:2-hydroxychromene-2-carboxylate isomerase [Variovorax sp. PCZ-1]MBS7808278.1 2-hydroxychromene-2-carboxylate isomerase [Variovorax sp. PCZ-1]